MSVFLNEVAKKVNEVHPETALKLTRFGTKYGEGDLLEIEACGKIRDIVVLESESAEQVATKVIREISYMI